MHVHALCPDLGTFLFSEGADVFGKSQLILLGLLKRCLRPLKIHGSSTHPGLPGTQYLSTLTWGAHKESPAAKPQPCQQWKKVVAELEMRTFNNQNGAWATFL